MVNYKCPRCGYEINIKTKYVNHLRRKKLCDVILSKTNLQTEYIKYGIKEKIIMNPNESSIESKIGFMNPNESKKKSIFVNIVKKLIQQVVI